MATENKLGTMPINKLIWNMSLPIIASMLVQALYNIVDSMFVSMVSQDALTAVSLAYSAQWLIISFATGTSIGVNALLSRYLGARDYQKVDSVASHGLFLAACMGVIIAIVGIFAVKPYFQAQTSIESILNAGYDYLSVVMTCSIAVNLQVMNERLLQATGRSKYSMFTQMLGAITNLILDPFFILPQVTIGALSIPGLDMGAKGAAIATVIGQLLASLLGTYYNLTVNADIHLTFKKFKPDLKMIGNIYSIAAPSIILLGIGSLTTFMMNKILIVYHKAHETAATAFGIYFKLNSFVFMPLNGLNSGIVPIIAYNYGAKKKERVTKTISLGITYDIIIMLLGMALLEIFPKTLINIFNPTEELMEVGVPCLRIIALSFTFAGICISLGSTMQALGKAVYSMINSMVRQVIFLIPSAYLLAKIGAERNITNLVWWSYDIAEIASLILSIIFFIITYKTLIIKIGDESTNNC